MLCVLFFFSFFPAACRRRLDDRTTACASIIRGCFFPQMHQSHCIRSNPPTCPSGVGIKAAGIHHPTHTHAITPTAPRCLARTAVLNLEHHAWLASGKSNSKAQQPNIQDSSTSLLLSSSFPSPHTQTLQHPINPASAPRPSASSWAAPSYTSRRIRPSDCRIPVGCVEHACTQQVSRRPST